MCRQEVRNEVPEAGKPALSCHHSRAHVTVRIRHAYRIFCSRSNWVSFVAWRITGGASLFLGRSGQSALVRACCGLVSKSSGRGRRLPPTRPFDATLLLWRVIG